MQKFYPTIQKICRGIIWVLLTIIVAIGTYETLLCFNRNVNKQFKLYNSVGCVLFPNPSTLESSLFFVLKQYAQQNNIKLITKTKLCPTKADFIILNRKSAQTNIAQKATGHKYLVLFDDCSNPLNYNPTNYTKTFVNSQCYNNLKNKQNTLSLKQKNPLYFIAAHILMLPHIQNKVEIALLGEAGLGNQMFSYATNKAYALRFNKETYLQKNHAYIKNVFALPDRELKTTEFSYSNYKKLTNDTSNETGAGQNCEKCFTHPNIIQFTGYLQSYKNFQDYEDEIRKAFTFPPFKKQKNIELAKQISNQNSVSIHVRLGDYITNQHLLLHKSNYYQNAITYIKKHVENPHFYIFTNDPNYLKQNLKLNIPYTLIDWNTGADSFRDMQLMSLCKHNIIANSTFSWWPALLNKNPNKIVTFPDIWDSTNWGEALHVPGWIEIGTDIKINRKQRNPYVYPKSLSE